jgi:O-antigen ligase
MGATLALLCGATIAIGALSLSGHAARVASATVQLLAATLLLVSVLYYVTSHNDRYQAHFERIFLGRAERSSGGRLNLWQRGFEVFIDHDAILWGVGPENFREVDGRGNQLHSDFIAFLVERGLIGTFGLLLLAGTAFSRALHLIWIYNKHPGRVGIEGFVFLGATVAVVVESLTHQVFHFRELWLVLALQEAIAIHATRAVQEVEPVHQSLFVDIGIPSVTK